MKHLNRSDSELGAFHLSSWQEHIPASILWGSRQAGDTIVLAACGWMVSGLIASPLVCIGLLSLALLHLWQPLTLQATA